jgi:hypothetical protein
MCRRAPISVTLALLGWAEKRVVLIRLQEGKQDLSVQRVLNLALRKVANCKLNAEHYGVGIVSKCVDERYMRRTRTLLRQQYLCSKLMWSSSECGQSACSYIRTRKDLASWHVDRTSFALGVVQVRCASIF